MADTDCALQSPQQTFAGMTQKLSRMAYAEKTHSFLKPALPCFYFLLLHFISIGEHASVLNQAQAILFFI